MASANDVLSALLTHDPDDRFLEALQGLLEEQFEANDPADSIPPGLEPLLATERARLDARRWAAVREASRARIDLYDTRVREALTFVKQVIDAQSLPSSFSTLKLGESHFYFHTKPGSLLFLMGVGPALPWRKGAGAELKGRLLPGVILGVVAMIAVIALGGRSVYAVLAFLFAGFGLGVNVAEFVRGANARVAAHGEAFPMALVRLIGANRRRYGGYLAHIGVVLVALGVAASSTFKTEQEATLKPGESVTVAGHTLRFKAAWGRQERQREVIGATMEWMDGDRVRAVIEPRMNYYPTSQQPVPTPDVRSTLRGDIYLSLMAFKQDGSNVTVKVIWEPLVPWIWFGGYVVVLGAIVGAWPTRERVRQRAAVAAVAAPSLAEGQP